MEEFTKLQEGVFKMKERYKNLLLYRDPLLMMDEMCHVALKEEEEKLERLISKLEITSNSLNITQRALQDSNLKTYKFQKDLKVPHLSFCMEENVLGIMEESHVEDEREKISYLQLVVKEDTIEYID